MAGNNAATGGKNGKGGKSGKQGKKYTGEVKTVTNPPAQPSNYLTAAENTTITPSGTNFGTASGVSNPNKDPSGNKLPYAIQQYTPQMATLAEAPTIQDYAAPQWSNDYLKNIDTSYYTNAVDRYKNYAEQNRANQLGEAEKAQKNALTQAYVTKLQNERKMADNLARAGIRGGATETSMLNLANQYGTARNAANTDYSNSVNTINQAIDSNIFDYQSDMDARAEEYRQNMGQAQWQADRENYGNTYQANLDRLWNIYNATNDLNMANVQAANDASKSYYDALNNAYINDYNAKREDKQNKNANGEFGTVNYYTNRYSTKSKKNLKKLENKLEKQKDKLAKGGVKKSEKQEYKQIKNRLAGIAAARANKNK